MFGMFGKYVFGWDMCFSGVKGKLIWGLLSANRGLRREPDKTPANPNTSKTHTKYIVPRIL